MAQGNQTKRQTNENRAHVRMGAARGSLKRGSTLAGFEPRVAFVDDVDPAAAAHNSAAFFTQLGRLQRVSDFHNSIPG